FSLLLKLFDLSWLDLKPVHIKRDKDHRHFGVSFHPYSLKGIYHWMNDLQDSHQNFLE
ncbi:hypothetical protein Tco_0430164, partial [Tanacetum coccineum]